MKKGLLGVKGRNIFLALCCLVLAFVFWFIVEYTQMGAYALFNFS